MFFVFILSLVLFVFPSVDSPPHEVTMLRKVFKLDHTDGVVTPGLGHGPYLCVGITSDVILQDGVNSSRTSKTT